MKIKYSIISILITVIVFLTSCADTPENVINKKQGQEDKTDIGERVTVDRLLDGVEDVATYVKEHGYEDKFVIEDEIHIDLPEQIFELETETVENVHLRFPEIYSELL